MESVFTMLMVSSTYLDQSLMWSVSVGRSVVSKSTIQMSDSMEPRGEPIATPSVWMYVSLLNVKCTCLVQRIRSCLRSEREMLVSISFSS